ncbi:MAG: ATP-dependent zinc metalloprotease FtsH [Clostridiales bacterium]|nr:ATP-dependent zinc metalloprotease FtsH [Clostridiales bacterium]
MNKKNIILVVSAIFLISLLFIGYRLKKPEKINVAYNNFLLDVDKGRVDTVYLSDKAELKVKLKDGSIIYTDNPRDDKFKEELLKKNINVEEVSSSAIGDQASGMFLSLLLFATAGYFLFKFTAKQRSGGLLDITRVQNETESEVNIGFSNVAGNEEAKDSVRDIVDFLKDPEKYLKYGARMPKGVIFYGPPGTGKTLLAKAVAGESGVPFYALSGSDFVQVYVGVGAGRIRNLFKKAREKGKCVIFIDEIDALGKKRESGGIDGGNDEREQTLNALLSEMSGFKDSDGIVVIAATNRLDILDEALLRPGRFDRCVEVGLPDVKSRYEILKIHAANKPISSDLDLYKVAEQSVYFSGAMLENMVNEAAIFAAKRNAGSIGKQDMDKAFYTVVAGAEKKDRSSINKADMKITAYHETGHVVVSKLIVPHNTIPKVTIIPSTRGAGGYTMNIPPDRMYKTKSEMEKDIMVSLGGRCAEEIVFGEENITTGASGDIDRVTEIVLSMVKKFGMSRTTGILSYDVLYKNSFGGINSEILNECRQIVDGLYNKVKDLLISHRYLLDKMAEELLNKETLDENEIDRIIAA